MSSVVALLRHPACPLNGPAVSSNGSDDPQRTSAASHALARVRQAPRSATMVLLKARKFIGLLGGAATCLHSLKRIGW